VAVDLRRARNGGFTLVLSEGLVVDGQRKANLWRPEVTIKADGSKRQFIGFTKPPRLDEQNLDRGRPFRGRFLDLHTLAYVLTDRSLSLDAAAVEFDVAERKASAEHAGTITAEYIDYNRQDVRTTYALYQALLREWARHPIDLDPEQAFSPAAMSKAYLRVMGVKPPLRRTPPIEDPELGAAMSAYFGGRADARIRRTPIPVRYLDYTSMYVTVFALMDLRRFVVADHFGVEEATEDVHHVLASLGREALHEPATWPSLAGVFCLVDPSGALLPVRARYGQPADARTSSTPWTIGLNPLQAGVPMWYPLADIVAAGLLGETSPGLIRAIRVAPSGQQPALRPVLLRGELEVDPRTDDLFRRAIELRQRVRRDISRPANERDRLDGFLKTFALGGAYGIFAEYHPTEPVAGGARVSGHGLWPLECRVHTPEEPGEFCFPPLAATITAGARLLLALLQADVEARGGTYVAGDTDALLVASSELGGLVACPGGPYRLPDGGPAIQALSWDEVDEVRAAINALSPYDRGLVSSLVKLEDENLDEATGAPCELFAIAISTKRYALYERTPTGPRIRKASTHGLGMYRRPYPDPPGWTKPWPAWVEDVWVRIIREIEGLPALPEPGWFDLPAVGQLPISSPAILEPFREWNRGRPYADQVKPFGFLLVGHADPLLPTPPGLLSPVVPVAPFSTDAQRLLELPWRTKAEGLPVEVTTKARGERGKVRLKSYRDVYLEYRFHAEAKSGDPSGGPGMRTSTGLLPRLTVEVDGLPRHIGRESNELEEVESGSIMNASPYTEYHDERQEWKAMVPRLRRLRDERGWRYLAAESGLSERAIRYALNDGRLPHREARGALMSLSQARSPEAQRLPDASTQTLVLGRVRSIRRSRGS
jgi:hypothetical protein